MMCRVRNTRTRGLCCVELRRITAGDLWSFRYIQCESIVHVTVKRSRADLARRKHTLFYTVLAKRSSCPVATDQRLRQR